MKDRLFHLCRRWSLSRHAPRTDRKKILGLLKVYRSIDGKTARFRRATGLSCVPGCGHCCDNPKIEATLLEFLPLASWLWREGKAEAWLERLQTGEQVCVFFKRTAGPGPGRCSVYPWRPLICRMFGFSAVQDKHGQPSLVTCSLMKAKDPDGYQRARQMIAQGLSVPKMADYARQVEAIDLLLAQQKVPINQAIRSALERTGFLLNAEKGKTP